MVLRMFYFYDTAREICFPIEADTDTAVLLNYFAFQSLRLFFSDFNLCDCFSQISIFAPVFLRFQFLHLFFSDFNLCAHEFGKLFYDRSVAGPCGGGDEIAVDYSLVHGNFDIGAAGKCDVRTDSGVSGCLISLEDTCCGEDLRAMADCGDGLFGREELTHNLKDAGVQTNIFRSTAAGDEESLIIFGLDRVKISSQSKVVSPQLSIGLLTEEIVDSSCHSFSCLLVGADCVDLISQDAESLERHHGLIIFCEITA